MHTRLRRVEERLGPGLREMAYRAAIGTGLDPETLFREAETVLERMDRTRLTPEERERFRELTSRWDEGWWDLTALTADERDELADLATKLVPRV